MLWIFSRGSEQIRIENRYDKQTDEFLLIVEPRGEAAETMRFGDARAFRTWLSTFAKQLEAEGWTPSGSAIDAVESASRRPAPPREITTTAPRQYTSGTRTFDILLSRMALRGAHVWMVERVREHRGDRRFPQIPGMQGVTASTPDEAFARACDCIDKWLWPSRQG